VLQTFTIMLLYDGGLLSVPAGLSPLWP
jgi:hypothetical protein